MRGDGRVFAVRDRDFLPQDLLEGYRRDATIGAEPAPFPLRRHCIESYLCEPAFVAAATGLDVGEFIEERANDSFWTDVCRACLRQVEYDAREPRVTLAANPRDEPEAVAALRQALDAYRGRLAGTVDPGSAEQMVAAFAADFAADGPVWTRIDGKKLLADIGRRWPEASQLPGGLGGRLLKHAEAHGAPEPLVTEMRHLLGAIEAVLTSPAPDTAV